LCRVQHRTGNWYPALLDPVLGDRSPTSILLLAVLLTAWYGGSRPALVSATLGLFLADFFLVMPRYSFHIVGVAQWVDLALYLGVSLAIALVGGFMHSAPLESVRKLRNAHKITTRAALLRAGSLQSAIFTSPNFSCIATDEKGIIQLFNAGAERMFGYKAHEVMDKIMPADLHDPKEVIARGIALSLEYKTEIAPGFGALAFKAARGIEDIYEVTKIRKDGSRFPAIVSVTALRNDVEEIIGYLLIGTDITARKRTEEALEKARSLQNAIFSSPNFSCIATDAKGIIQLFNVGAERMFGHTVEEVRNKITPAELHDPAEMTARAAALSAEYSTPVGPGFDAVAFKASRGIEDIYEMTKVRKDGTRFPALLSVAALRDESGGISGYLLIAIDNTARKNAEEASLKAEVLQSAVFSNPNFSCIVLDTKGVIQICSVGIERMLGITTTEVMNATPLGACPSISPTSWVQMEQSRYIMFYGKRLPHLSAGARPAVAAEPARMAA